MGVSLYHWMAYFMENPLKTEDDWEYPYFRTPPFDDMNHIEPATSSGSTWI